MNQVDIKKKEGKVTIEVLNEDGEVIKSESVQTKGETSIWIFFGERKKLFCKDKRRRSNFILFICKDLQYYLRRFYP